MTHISRIATDDRTARMLLAMVSAPSDPLTGRLLAAVGGIETLHLCTGSGPAAGLSEVEAEIWRARLAPLPDPHAARDMIYQSARRGFETLIPGDQHFPTALKDLGNQAPYVLWTRGATSFLARPLNERVTITGSRAATAYGQQVASELAADLSNTDRVIIAGGAYGVEAAAHRAALAAGGGTVAVLPCGLDIQHPAGHRDLLNRIGDVGLLVSELPPGTTPTRRWFLARTRTLAALSGSTIITEASQRSIALKTADHAHLLRRGVGAVPGPVTSVTSAGVHDLIKHGMARLVTNAEDVTILLGHGEHTGHRISGPVADLGTSRRQRPPSTSYGPSH